MATMLSISTIPTIPGIHTMDSLEHDMKNIQDDNDTDDTQLRIDDAFNNVKRQKLLNFGNDKDVIVTGYFTGQYLRRAVNSIGDDVEWYKTIFESTIVSSDKKYEDIDCNGNTVKYAHINLYATEGTFGDKSQDSDGSSKRGQRVKITAHMPGRSKTSRFKPKDTKRTYQSQLFGQQQYNGNNTFAMTTTFIQKQ